MRRFRSDGAKIAAEAEVADGQTPAGKSSRASLHDPEQRQHGGERQE
jgi:hypothetical protein